MAKKRERCFLIGMALVCGLLGGCTSSGDTIGSNTAITDPSSLQSATDVMSTTASTTTGSNTAITDPSSLQSVTDVISTTASTTTSQERKESMKVVIIGDSNTEYGHITNALNEVLVDRYGSVSSGFLCFSNKSAQPKPAGVTINLGAWNSDDVTTDTNWWGTEQIDGPFGLNVYSDEPDTTLTVRYRHAGFSLYYLKQPGGGKLQVTVDDSVVAELDTNADKKETAKYTYLGTSDGRANSAEIKLVSGKATLFGVELLNDSEYGGVCHNWGNAGANSQHFYHADANVFESALRELDPTHVVYLIGTNDGIEHTKFKEALVEQINRIKRGTPKAKILLVSTFDIDYEAGKPAMSNYLKYAYPVAAQETNVTYWNMHEFFGPYNSEQMQDGWHCNAVGGKKIAEEMFKELIAIS